MKHDVFISYSSKDKTVADAVCHVLEKNGLSCWIAPRDVRPGARYAIEIVNGIRNSRAMVLVYSEHSNQSDHVASEVEKAFNSEKTIIPFMLDSTPMNDEFDYYLSRKHWLVAYPHYEEKLDQLVAAVASVLEVGNAPSQGTSPEELQDNASVSGSPYKKPDRYHDCPNLKIKSDLDCVFYIDGEEKARLKAGNIKMVPLAQGEYELRFVSVENAVDMVEMVFEMPDYDKIQRVYLRKQRDARLEKEVKARKEKEEKRIAEEKALLEAALNYGDNEQYEEAVKLLRKLVQSDNAEAQMYLGACYIDGLGVPQDDSEGVKWVRKAAEQGNARAQFCLGGCYADGLGVPKDNAEAEKWFRKAAEHGNAEIQYELGSCYECGEGVPQNYAEAVKCYRKAADLGDVDAQYALSRCYENGLGVPQNSTEAARWRRKAEKQRQ